MRGSDGTYSSDDIVLTLNNLTDKFNEILVKDRKQFSDFVLGAVESEDFQDDLTNRIDYLKYGSGSREVTAAFVNEFMNRHLAPGQAPQKNVVVEEEGEIIRPLGLSGILEDAGFVEDEFISGYSSSETFFDDAICDDDFGP